MIHRAVAPGGPFSRPNPWTVLRTSTFEDSSLPPFTRYYYRVAAVDSSGNRGPWSAVISATTSLPLHTGWPRTWDPVPAGVGRRRLERRWEPGGLGLGRGNPGVHRGWAGFRRRRRECPDPRAPHRHRRHRVLEHACAGDVNGDGSTEVAAIGWGDCNLYLVNAQGQAFPAGGRRTPIPSGSWVQSVGSVCLGDVDADEIWRFSPRWGGSSSVGIMTAPKSQTEMPTPPPRGCWRHRDGVFLRDPERGQRGRRPLP